MLNNCEVIILGGREFGALPMFEKLHKHLVFLTFLGLNAILL